MLCDDASLTDQQFGHNIVSPKFFSYDFKNTEHLITLVNSNAASGEPLIIFIALMVSPSDN